jgi:hypothetical protein
MNDNNNPENVNDNSAPETENVTGDSAPETVDLPVDPFRVPRNTLRGGLYSEILPGLWQGGTHVDDGKVSRAEAHPDSRTIKSNEFDLVATFYQKARPADWHVLEMRYPFWDGEMNDANMDYLIGIARFLHSEWKRGKRVLSRCAAGWNRSGLIVALILIIDGYSAEAAINLIRVKRSSDALCNPRFEAFLRGVTPSNLASSSI